MSDVEKLFGRLSMTAVEARRIHLSNTLHASLDGTVRHGPLQGLRVLREGSWGAGDLGAKLLGLYEQEVLETLAAHRGGFDVLVNLGAGDGFYGVGLVVAGMVGRSVCFEASEEGRAALLRTAELNGVADRVEILGAAGPDFMAHPSVAGLAPARRLILVDIEGGEFDLLTDEVLAAARESHLVVELHGRMVRGGSEQEARLLERLGTHFACSLLMTGARDPARLPELASMGDSDRWLLCSEGRPYPMRWACCAPREIG